MARGKSGRVVLEIDPELKNRIYQALSIKNQTLKEWFIAEAQLMIRDELQLGLFDQTDTTNNGEHNE